MKNQPFFKNVLFAVLSISIAASINAQEIPPPERMTSRMTQIWEPEPEVVTPAKYPDAAMLGAPSDAIVLFDGKDLSEWQHPDGSAARWTVHDGVFTVNKGTGEIRTKREFEDFQLHIEWKIPENITGENQHRGNSGIFLQGRYEIQVLDSYKNRTYINGQAGSIYKQAAPLKNAMRPPGEWNVFDIIYTAPRFKDNGTLFSPARVTVIHNGVVIQNNFHLRGDTPNVGLPEYEAHGKGPISLQDHGDPSEPISFRNIWIREM